MNTYSEIYTVQKSDLDFLGHVNNKSYLDWMEKLAWSHAVSVGIDKPLQRKLNRILAIYEHQMRYLASSYEGDRIALKTWVGKRIGCCQRERFFEFVRLSDNKTVFEANSIYVCITLDSHRPKKIPQEFIDPYFQNQAEI
ncbi:acyl-CoA thioesterase [Thiomicrorhabdus xiamenensis]|uniref:Acyl-CoA thioesterase n=1 Tax=Thiomicrorhabdus xiamenensis TaxID=2739063 RepID=A0A7D4NQM4_9GAMM|nr:acyl-CoA thioesterase [Thiomicrorhabdus xiamenensis]QKI88830.1 acyl-CoA thioesterase [Thiomicrorhabdus xiamenensis]